MAEQFSELTDSLIRFIEKQPVYFTGTARADGRVNVSPKGGDSLRILSPGRLVWQNLTGSGNETAAHLMGNNRMTIMYCAFDRKPLILRVYGTATTIHPRDPQWQSYVDIFPHHLGTRQFFVMDIDLVQTSCGFAVPRMDFIDHRDTLNTWTEKKGETGINDYWRDVNRLSIDGFDTGIVDRNAE